MTQYAVVYNTDLRAMVALPSTDVLDDLAFDKGWRVIHQDLDRYELQRYEERFNLELMDAVKFRLDYIADEELTDEDVDYINSCSQEFFTENQPDSDDEEIDVEFFEEEETQPEEE